jgi:hypothetical protein
MTEPRDCCCSTVTLRDGRVIRHISACCPIHHRDRTPETRDA